MDNLKFDNFSFQLQNHNKNIKESVNAKDNKKIEEIAITILNEWSKIEPSMKCSDESHNTLNHLNKLEDINNNFALISKNINNVYSINKENLSEKLVDTLNKIDNIQNQIFVHLVAIKGLAEPEIDPETNTEIASLPLYEIHKIPENSVFSIPPNLDVKSLTDEEYARIRPLLDLHLVSDEDYARFRPLNGISKSELKAMELLYQKIIDGQTCIEIKGNDKFSKHIKEDIKILLTRAIGRKLINRLTKYPNGTKLRIEEGRESKCGVADTDNKKANITINLQSESKEIGEDTLGRRSLINFDPSYITLGHEMIHASHYFDGIDIQTREPTTMGQEFDELEEQFTIIGLYQPLNIASQPIIFANEEDWDDPVNYPEKKIPSGYNELNERELAAPFVGNDQTWHPRVGHHGVDIEEEEVNVEQLIKENVLVDLKNLFNDQKDQLADMLDNLNSDIKDKIAADFMEKTPQVVIDFLFGLLQYFHNQQSDELLNFDNLPIIMNNYSFEYFNNKIEAYKNIKPSESEKFFRQMIFDALQFSFDEESSHSVLSKDLVLNHILTNNFFSTPQSIVKYISSIKFPPPDFNHLFNYIVNNNQELLDKLTDKEREQFKVCFSVLKDVYPNNLTINRGFNFNTIFNDQFKKYHGVFEDYIKHEYNALLINSFKDHPFALSFFKELIDNPMLIFHSQDFRKYGNILTYLMNFIEKNKDKLIVEGSDPIENLMEAFILIPKINIMINEGDNIRYAFDQIVKMIQTLQPGQNVIQNLLDRYELRYDKRSTVLKAFVEYLKQRS